MRKIETHCPRVPWGWVGWMTCPWVIYYLVDNLTVGGPLVFTIRKYISNPATIGFLTSLKVAFDFVVGVAASYLSDRIWTRWGRRRPFLIAGWLGVAAMLLLFPLAGSAASLVPLIVGFQFAQAIAKPLEPLYNDIVPAAQRGRAAMVRLAAQNLTGLLFYGVLLSQFDRQYAVRWLGRWTLSGEAVLYWSVALATLAVTGFLMLGVREKPPTAGEPREVPDLRGFLRSVFGQRQWWMVYLLYATPLLAGVSTENFTALVRTEQLGFSKQQVGWVMSAAVITGTVVAAPVAGFLADRVSRFGLFRIGIVGPALVNLTLFVVLHNGRSQAFPLSALVAFTLVAGALQSCLWVVWGPLIYDYIPSRRFGTVSAGLAFVGGIAPFILLNAGGLWIDAFTRWFGPAGAGSYDYSSIYVLNAVGAVASLLVIGFFVREEKRGHVVAYGRNEPRHCEDPGAAT